MICQWCGHRDANHEFFSGRRCCMFAEGDSICGCSGLKQMEGENDRRRT